MLLHLLCYIHAVWTVLARTPGRHVFRSFRICRERQRIWSTIGKCLLRAVVGIPIILLCLLTLNLTFCTGDWRETVTYGSFASNATIVTKHSNNGQGTCFCDRLLWLSPITSHSTGCHEVWYCYRMHVPPRKSSDNSWNYATTASF